MSATDPRDPALPLPMSASGRRQVGIRELRQNLSVYVQRIKDGEEFVVTERGQPVAHLGAPRPAQERTLAAAIAQGIVTVPRTPGGALAVTPRKLPAGVSLFESLMEERNSYYEDERS